MSIRVVMEKSESNPMSAGLTFAKVEAFAKQHGYCIQRCTDWYDGERKSPGYELFSNDHMPGETFSAPSLMDVYSEVYYRVFPTPTAKSA